MDDNDAAGVLRRMLAAFSSGDASDCGEYIAPTYVDHQGRNGVALHGPEGFEQVVRSAHRSAVPRLILEDLIATDARAAARVRWRFMPTENSDGIERETIEIVRVENGYATEHWGAESWARTLGRPAV